jgi:pyrophosphatase PpaX
MNLKGMIFDLDGTLGDTMPVVTQALQETFQHFTGHHYTSAEIFSMFGPSEEGVIARRVPPDVFPDALRFYLARYAELHQSARQPFPGVIELLELLQARGIHRGVVTGKGTGTAEISMRAMGLQPHIETLIAGSPNGAEKPQAILQVLADWELLPAQAAYVGDMPYDMRAARQVGALPLGAAWSASATVEKEDVSAGCIFHSVSGLIDWVKIQTIF